MHDVTEIRNEAPAETRNQLHVGENLPKAMRNVDMMRAFGISKPTFFKLQRAGEFRPFLLPRPIAGKKYSGERVQEFLKGRK